MSYQNAIQVQKRIVAEDSRPSNSVRLGGYCISLGDAFGIHGDHEAARQMFNKAVKVFNGVAV